MSGVPKKYTIEAKILPLAGVSGHLYLEIFDENGDRYAQINGFATDRKTREPKSIGYPGDLLKVYLSEVLMGTNSCTRDKHCHAGRAIFEGSRADIDRAYAAAQRRSHELNALELPYKLLSLNSNTIFMEIVRAMQKEISIDEKALKTVAKMRPLFPGLATDFAKAVQKIGRKPKPESKPRDPRP